MTCQEARALLLEADLPALAGRPDTALGRHIEGCTRCAAAAGRILATERAMARGLAEAAPGQSTEDLLQRSLGARPGRRARRVALPLAAAAGLTLALLMWPARDKRPAGLSGAAEAVAGGTVQVEGPPGRSVAVFETPKPDIVVIWFF